MQPLENLLLNLNKDNRTVSVHQFNAKKHDAHTNAHIIFFIINTTVNRVNRTKTIGIIHNSINKQPFL